MNHRCRIFAGVLTLALLGQRAAADSLAPAGTLAHTLADLGAEDVHQRDHSESIIRAASNEYPLGTLEQLLRDPSLGPERHARLDRLARERFIGTPRPALGVQFVSNSTVPVIDRVFPGFPAGAVLRPGDTIVAIEGVELRSRDGVTRAGVRPLIISHDPGEELPIEILRNASTVQLRVPLGSFADLPGSPAGSSQILPEELDEAWALRRQRLGLDTQEPLRADVRPADWTPGGRTRAQLELELISDCARQNLPSPLAGGRPRPAPPNGDPARVSEEPEHNILVQPNAQPRPHPNQAALQRELDMLELRIGGLRAAITRAAQRRSDPQLRVSERAEAAQQLQDLTAEMNQLQQRQQLLRLRLSR